MTNKANSGPRKRGKSARSYEVGATNLAFFRKTVFINLLRVAARHEVIY